MSIKRVVIVVAMLTCAGFAQTPPWSGILGPTYGIGSCTLLPTSTYAACGVDWTAVGVPGGVPIGTQAGTTIQPTGAGSNCTNSTTDCTAVINAALSACGGSFGNDKYVQLATGTFFYNGVITVPSYCYLVGMGANLTLLNQGTSSSVQINLGSASDTGAGGAVNVTSGATAGSTSLVLASVSGMTVGQLLVISELNNSFYVDAVGSESNAGGLNGQFCVFQWGPSSNGHARLRCQVTQITAINTGTKTVTIATPLVTDFGDNATVGWTASTYYGQYGFITDSGFLYEQTASIGGSPFHCQSGGSKPTFPTSAGSVNDNNCTWTFVASSPSLQAQVIAYSPNATYAGIENLQINGSTGNANSTINTYDGAFNFIKGVQVNYTNCNWVQMVQGFRNEVRDSYFSNAFPHGSGSCDAMLEMRSGESNSLVENNIFERGHVGAVLLESGPTGNVIGYNYCVGNFPGDNGSGGEWNIPCFQYHGGHPQFNLHEGNVGNTIRPDSVWGTSSHGVLFRNLDLGTTLGCNPISSSVSSPQTVVCSPFGYPYQTSPTVAKSWYMYQQSQGVEFVYASNFFNAIGEVVGSNKVQSPNFKTVSNTLVTRAASIQWPTTRVYDNYYGIAFGFSESNDSGSFVLDSTRPFTTALIHGLYNNQDGSITWQSPITHTLPSSFYRPSKPAWWGTMPWPVVGPDVTTGDGPNGHSYLTASNPAMNCYLNIMGGSDGGPGSPLPNFNAANCYPTYVVVPKLQGNVTILGNGGIR